MGAKIWVNPDPDPISEQRFHQYGNADYEYDSSQSHFVHFCCPRTMVAILILAVIVTVQARTMGYRPGTDLPGANSVQRVPDQDTVKNFTISGRKYEK